MLDAHQDIFTMDECSVGKTSWDTFKIELIPNARPVNRQIEPLPPPPKKKI